MSVEALQFLSIGIVTDVNLFVLLKHKLSMPKAIFLDALEVRQVARTLERKDMVYLNELQI